MKANINSVEIIFNFPPLQRQMLDVFVHWECIAKYFPQNIFFQSIPQKKLDSRSPNLHKELVGRYLNPFPGTKTGRSILYLVTILTQL